MLEMLKNYLVSDFEETYPTVRFRDKKNLIQVMKDVFSYTKCPFVILIDSRIFCFENMQQDNEAQKISWTFYVLVAQRYKTIVALAYMTEVFTYKNLWLSFCF